MRRLLKRAILQWGATLTALLILLLGGLLGSWWLTNQQGLPLGSLPSGIFSVWRFALYGSALFVWPCLVRFRGRHQDRDEAPTTARWPVVTAIALYEFLVVQNPLAWLGDLLMGKGG